MIALPMPLVIVVSEIFASTRDPKKDNGFPYDGLLQVKGVVPESEIRSPRDLDERGNAVSFCNWL